MDFAKINHCFTTAISNLAEQEIEATQSLTISEEEFDPVAVLTGKQRPPRTTKKGFVDSGFIPVLKLANILDELGPVSEKVYWAAKKGNPVHKADIKKTIKEIEFVIKGKKSSYPKRGYNDIDFQKWAKPFNQVHNKLLDAIKRA